MNKRMKDPKGDLRFVHKSTRVYDFWSLKLTAMAAAGRQDTKDLMHFGKDEKKSQPLTIRIQKIAF
jgi:hypothetical protein